MSENSEAVFTKISTLQLMKADLTNNCRICRCSGHGLNLRPLFNGRRLTRLIANTIHIEVEDLQGLPRFICEKCLNMLKTFSIFQVNFRRSEEDFKVAIEDRENFHMDSLISFAQQIEMEKQMSNDMEKDQKSAPLAVKAKKKTKKAKKSKRL